MDLLQFYYLAGVPLLTYNMLFYSITSLSTSITSSQNVFKFIYEHKESDYTIYINEIENMDLHNKLRIIYSLILNVLEKYCDKDDDFELLLNEIKNPTLIMNDIEDIDNIDKMDNIDNKDKNDFSMVEIKSKSSILEKIDKPILYALMSTFETVDNIYMVLNKIRDKIIQHKKSYLKIMRSICLKNELSTLKKYSILLDTRLQLLLELLKIFLPLIKK